MDLYYVMEQLTTLRSDVVRQKQVSGYILGKTKHLFKNEKKRQDCQNSSLKNCLIQYESVFLLNKNGNFAEIFQ